MLLIARASVVDFPSGDDAKVFGLNHGIGGFRVCTLYVNSPLYGEEPYQVAMAAVFTSSHSEQRS